MKTYLIPVFIVLCVALCAAPRGLTSREIIEDGTLAGIQAQTTLTIPPAAPAAIKRDFRDDWYDALAQPLGIMLPAKAQFGLRYNNLTQGGEVFSSLGELLPETLAAVAKAPIWIRPELQATLNQLAPDRQLLFANLVNNAVDPYVDEIAFCVATASPEYLNSDFALPELFTENAQMIYSADAELPYVEIVDTGSSDIDYYYSTTRYWKKDANGELQQETVPMEVYYWYLVSPKITDEIQAYIDPSIIENNSTHSNNIAPPPAGKFWRSYIYDFEEDGYPVLSDTLTLCQTVFNRDGMPGDAARAIIWWINHNMSFTSNNERPHQPVRIFEKRIGRCGEYADLTAAVARTALIPCNNISSISTDHTWNEFWEDGWVSWEPVNGYINSPLVYENGWGKVFGSVFEERFDGLFTPVTDRYSEGLATINIQVVDQNMAPVDGARVVLAILDSSIRFDSQQYTDNNGLASFLVGENRDYRGRAETSFGLYPANPGTYAQLVSNSVDGETYNYQFVIPAALPQPAIEALADPDDPAQDFRFLVGAQCSWYYVTGRTLWDDIDVLGSSPHFYNKQADTQASAAYMVTDADNLLFLQLENFCSAYSYLSPAYNVLDAFDIPVGQDWYAFLDNSHRHGNAVMLGGSIELEHWGTAVDDPQAPPAAFRLLTPSPNPFSGSTLLKLETAEAGPVCFEVFNLRGQKVRSAQALEAREGAASWDWDGRDGDGNELPNGVYLIRAKGSQSSATGKVLRCR